LDQIKDSDLDICSSSLIAFIIIFTGTFTLSNLGMFGVDRFDAILPPGTVSVLLVVKYCKRLAICSNSISDGQHEYYHSLDLFV